MDILQMYRGGHACVTMQNESGDYFPVLVMNIVELHIMLRIFAGPQQRTNITENFSLKALVGLSDVISYN